MITGTGRLTRLGLRTGGIGLLLVVVLTAGLVTLIAGSITALYGDAGERLRYAETIGTSPASLAFNGRGYGLETIGGITAFEIGFIGQLLFPLLAVHVALRHTRREEEAGRTEVLTAGRVGRLAPLAAGKILVAGVCLAIGVLMFAGLVAVGLPATGSAWYAAGIAVFMLFFGMVGLLLGQLAQSARTAYLTGLALITGAFLLRAVIDGMGWAALWLSPLGWLPEVRAFAEPQAWPLVAYAAGGVVLLGFAVLIARGRDLGAGVLTPRPGPARGRPGLATVPGVTWRLLKGPALTWVVIAVVWAACFGALTQEMSELIDANPALVAALGAEGGVDIVTSLAVVVVCLAATALAAQSAGRLGAEESAGRLGAVLATRVPRLRLWLGWWSVVTVLSLAVLALGTAALGLATWAVTGDAGAVGNALGVGAGYAAPVAFVVAIAALLRAAAPQVAGMIWLLVAWIVLVGFLAETLRIPDWARDLSPLHLVGTLPQEDPALAAVLGLTAGTVLAFTASALAIGRRDLRAG